ncbi:MAG: flagellar hook-length control protein FliK [Treponema sp.]|nr:flagellar hook-length control protein FliK [Treponema sp.]
MQAVTVLVQQKIEPVEKINIHASHNAAGTSAEKPKEVSFSDRVDQARKEQPDTKQEKKSGRTKTDRAEKNPGDSGSGKVIADKNTEINGISGTVTGKNAVEFKTTVEKKLSEGKTKSEENIKNTAQKKNTDKKTKKPEKDYVKELSYLQGAETKETARTPDAIIEQAQEYVDTDEEKAKISLEKAQRMSVETPQQFLSEQSSVKQLAAGQTNASGTKETASSLKEKNLKLTKKEFALDKDGKIIVKDLRSDADKENVKGLKDAQGKLVTTVKKDSNGNAQMTMTLPDQVQQNILSTSDQSASASGSNFQAMLTNQIQQSAEDFVKAGSIVLKDNNVGTIKLVLHPESLGDVKINLQLSDKVVSGQITVTSQEAFNAFRESADSLKQAFIQNGFDTTGFSVAYSGANAGGSSFSNNRNNDDSRYSVAAVSGSYDNAQMAEAIPAMGAGSYVTAAHSLNIVA